MLLQSFTTAREFAEFDPQTGSLNRFLKEGAEMEALQAEMQGRYESVEKDLLVFYRQDALLHLRIAANDYAINEQTESRLRTSWTDRVIRRTSPPGLQSALTRLARSYSTFELIKNGTTLVTVRYPTPASSISAADFTPFVEDEDFDFVLFVHNVLSDPSRRAHIWTGTTVTQTG